MKVPLISDPKSFVELMHIDKGDTYNGMKSRGNYKTIFIINGMEYENIFNPGGFYENLDQRRLLSDTEFLKRHDINLEEYGKRL